MEGTLKVGDRIKLFKVGNIDVGICTVTKTRNFKSKGLRVHLRSQWDYGFMMWESNMCYEKVN